MAAPSTPNYPLAVQPPSYEETTGFNNSAPYPYPGPGYGTSPAAKEGKAPPYPTQPPNVPPGPMDPPANVQMVYVQNPLSFYDRPVQMVCPICKTLMVTRVFHNVGALAWLLSGGLCLFGCWLGCCLIPFCVEAFLDVDHFCSNCHAFLGTYKRL